MSSVNNNLFSVGIIHNPEMEVSKRMNMEVMIHDDKTFHYKFTKGKDKLNCIFGIYKTLQFSSIRDFGKTIQEECSAKDVFVSGLAGYEEVEVLVPSEIQRREMSGTLTGDYIQRTANNFSWSNTPGVLTIDIDGYKGNYFTKEEALELLYRAVPEFKNAPILIKPSTSSCVYYSGKARVIDKEGNEIRPEGSTGRTDLTGKSGLRFYIVISSLTWLYKAKQFLETRLWNIGYGYLDFNRNGVENFRSLIDTAMYSSTDRADFIKASLEEDIDSLEQDFGEFTYINEDNPPLDIRKIKDITNEELAWLAQNKDKERKSIVNIERQKAVIEKYIKDRYQEAEGHRKYSLGRSLSEKESNQLQKEVKNSVKRLYEEQTIDRLHSLYVLNKETKEVELLTTEDIFRSKESARKYHGTYCASVVDPFYTPGTTYNGDISAGNSSQQRLVGSNNLTIDFTKAKILSCNNPPSILDQSHGGIRFFFDTEFFDIANLELKRTDVHCIKLPIYNLTEIVNCFLNQYHKDIVSDVENFGNVLKNLEPDIGDIAFQVFDLALESNSSNKALWNDLTGYGPSLYDFMRRNSEKYLKVDLEKSKTIADVNKLDIKLRLKLMRQTYTKVMLPGGDYQFITKKWDNKFGWFYDMHPKSGVMGYYHDNEYYRVNSSDKTITEEISKLWFKREHIKFPGLEFHPVPGVVATNDNYIEGTSKDSFNLYTGLNLVPKPVTKSIKVDGDKINVVKGWYLLDKHIYEILCNKDKVKYEYMLNWIANMFQYPDRMGETILAFQGDEGTGKNTVWDAIITAFGSFGKNIVDGDLVLGNFNEVISRKILIVLNEAVWEGDVKGHGKLKSITTEPYLEISEKYKNSITVKNTLHIVIMTNHEAVAPMAAGDRRIATFDVNSKQSCNRKYFGKLRKEMNQESGIESFAYDMLKRDISNFNISELPNDTHSASAINSIMNTAQPWLKWWYECLMDDELYGYESEGKLNGGFEVNEKENKAVEVIVDGAMQTHEKEGTEIQFTGSFSDWLRLWKGRLPSQIVYESYMNWSRVKNDSMTSNRLTRNLKDLVVRSMKDGLHTDKELNNMAYKACTFKINGVNKARKCLMVGDLDTCRDALQKRFKRKIEWEDIEFE